MDADPKSYLALFPVAERQVETKALPAIFQAELVKKATFRYGASRCLTHPGPSPTPISGCGEPNQSQRDGLLAEPVRLLPEPRCRWPKFSSRDSQRRACGPSGLSPHAIPTLSPMGSAVQGRGGCPGRATTGEVAGSRSGEAPPPSKSARQDETSAAEIVEGDDGERYGRPAAALASSRPSSSPSTSPATSRPRAVDGKPARPLRGPLGRGNPPATMSPTLYAAGVTIDDELIEGPGPAGGWPSSIPRTLQDSDLRVPTVA